MEIVKSRELTPEEIDRIENNFTYHAPHGDQVERHGFIRSLVKQTVASICRLCPPSRELSLALTKFEEAVFWANAAIARNSRNEKE